MQKRNHNVQKSRIGLSLLRSVTRHCQWPRIDAGTLKARHVRRIFNEEAGRIIELPFYAGDTVKKGDVLVRFDARRLQVRLAKAKSLLAAS